MKVSSFELTALDLVRYLHVAGGIDAVATALADPAPRIDGGKLASLATKFERTTVLCLGYLLDRVGRAIARKRRTHSRSRETTRAMDQAGAAKAG